MKIISTGSTCIKAAVVFGIVSLLNTLSFAQIRKIKDVVIYNDTAFFSAFPSVVKLSDGKIMTAFRRAPNRQIFGEGHNNHVDANSYLVAVTSKDGEVWSKDPELIYAHAFGGSQDPCLLQLRDGTLLCTSYGWQPVRAEGVPNLKKPYFETAGYYFLGGYIVRSTDGGKKWTGPYYPSKVPAERNYTPYGTPVPAYNRGALYEGKNGIIYWIVAATDSTNKTSNYLLVSNNKGISWEYSGEVAKDPKISFNEASVYETPKGDIVGFLRTGNYNSQAVIARSSDGGKTFSWQSMGLQGYPLMATRLPDNRVLLVYGYRHKPYGIRARVLNAECTDWKQSKEFILRDDGGTGDLGYPWSVVLTESKVLVVYYFNKDNGVRHIAGSILEIQP